MPTTTDFEFDVFLSHSSKDKKTVRDIAKRLKADGLRVWFDEWEIKAGDSIPHKIEDGLERSRVLVLCMSKAAFGSDWAQLESGTFRFRDPLNKERRFIPVRLDRADIKGSLAQFLYVQWHSKDREPAYAKLLEACRPPEKPDTLQLETDREQSDDRVVRLEHTGNVLSVAWSREGDRAISGAGNNMTVRVWDVETGGSVRALNGHTDFVYAVAISSDGCHALSGARDNAVRMWDVEKGRCERLLIGHQGVVLSVAISGDGSRALSGAGDHTVRVWDTDTGQCEHILEGHMDWIRCVALSDDGSRAISGDDNGLVAIWDAEIGQKSHWLQGHTDSVRGVAMSSDGSRAISGSVDRTVRVWDVRTGRCERVLEGHTAGVNGVAWSTDGYRVISGSWDRTLRVWDIETGKCERVLKGHKGRVHNVAWSSDGRRAFSAAHGGEMRVWDLSDRAADSGATDAVEPKILSVPEQVQYTNAKVLLVGNTSAGKTGLSNRLALNIYTETDSTVGAWSTRWPLKINSRDGIEREIFLWDFGGQADQRLIHQLYMDQTHLAVLVFDPQKEALFDSLATWDRDLTRAATQGYQKLLVAGRIDVGGLRSVSRAQVETFAEERGFACYIETSSKDETGCEKLRQKIVDLIDWDQIAQSTTPALFKRLKEEIVQLKDEGRALMRFNELRDALRLRLAGEDVRFKDDELRAAVGLLAGPGVVWKLGFGSWILLKPELISSHALAVIRSFQEDEREIGCIAEERVLGGSLAFPDKMPQLPADEKQIVLLAMHQVLVERNLCLRDEDPEGMIPTMLVFPSYARRERPDLVDYPSVIVSYQFSGFLDDIYATLVVRLHHTDAFDRDQLWRDAADFKTMSGQRLGVKLTRRADGAGELEVYFEPDIPVELMMIFSKYVHEHLLRKAKDVLRLRHYVCPHKINGNPCETQVNRLVAMERLDEKGKKASIICVKCEKRVRLWDELEERYADPGVRRRVRELEEQSRVTLDTESKERVLVGEVISNVALADQICREFGISDHGIDMEVEFKDESEATGKKVYLQLKSGDSYLRTRKRDGAEIFDIKKQRHAKYWMAQAFPVMLIIRNSKGEIRWMEVRDWLMKASNNGKKQVNQIVFKGERFDVMSVRRWRKQALGGDLL